MKLLHDGLMNSLNMPWSENHKQQKLLKNKIKDLYLINLIEPYEPRNSSETVVKSSFHGHKTYDSRPDHNHDWPPQSL